MRTAPPLIGLWRQRPQRPRPQAIRPRRPKRALPRWQQSSRRALSRARRGLGCPSGPDSGYDPRIGSSSEQDELVGVVGPNGEILWVYEEQVPALNSRVTIQRRQQVPQNNPFGFVYE